MTRSHGKDEGRRALPPNVALRKSERCAYGGGNHLENRGVGSFQAFHRLPTPMRIAVQGTAFANFLFPTRFTLSQGLAKGTTIMAILTTNAAAPARYIGRDATGERVLRKRA